MVKVIRSFFCFLLSFVLIASLVASACVLGLTQMLEEENVDDILKTVSPGRKVMEYTRAESDRDISFGDALKEYLPLQTISLLSIYGDTARELTDAGIEAVEEYVASESAVKDFSKLAEVFTEGYIEKGKETGHLNGSIRYRSMYGWERDSRDSYARMTMLNRVEADLKKLAEEGTGFGKVTLNGRDVICYTPLAGKKAAEAENAVYVSLEEWYDGMYRDYCKGLLNYIFKGEDCLGGEGISVTEEDVSDLFITIVNNHGIGGSALEDASTKEEISKQIKDYVLPRIRKTISAPYSAWIDDGIVTGLKVTRTVFSMDPRIPLAVLCGGLLLIMLLIGGKIGLGFGCFSALLAGLALYAVPFFRQRALDELYRNLPQGIQDMGITETVLDQLLGHLSRYGLYCLVAAGVLLVLRLIVGAFSGRKEKSNE